MSNRGRSRSPVHESDKTKISELSGPFDDAFSQFTDDETASISGNFSEIGSTKSDQRSWHTGASRTRTSALAKLNFASLGLYGREHELGQLEYCFDQVANGAVERQLILISGESGTGKSVLANSLKDLAKKAKRGIYVRGKFGVKARGESHSGITSALAQICGHIVPWQAENPARYEEVCNTIRDDLGSELSVLAQLVPALRELMDFEEPEQLLNANETSIFSEDSKNRLRFAFQRFVKLVADQFAPLILVLDDIQWSDPSSLDFIDSLISNRKSSNILVICIYRSNEVDCTHIFYRMLEDLRRKKEEELFELLEIKIGNLTLDDVDSMVGDLFCIETDERTKQLAEVCLERTLGNAFFLRHFLYLLHDRNLLHFNPGLMGSGGAMGWTWDMDKIKAETAISENLVDLLKNKMGDLPPTLIEILKVAACLGFSFEEGILKKVLENMPTELPIDEPIMKRGFETLEEDGYIKRISGHSSNSSCVVLSWTHDKIHESALALEEDENERLAFSSRVGKILASQLDQRELDSVIFVAVNLLNQATESTDEESVKVAALNYRASQKAVSLSMFESASVYAAYGIKFLPENCWMDHYELSLGLFSTGAQTEGYLGNVETMERYCNQVLSIENVPLEDKLIIYQILIEGIRNRGSPIQAAELAFDVLRKCGCRFPKNSLAVSCAVIRNVVRIKATLGSLDVGGFSELKDPRPRLMGQLSTCLFLVNDKRLPLVIFRTLDVTKKCGYSDYSSVAFVMTGMMLIGVMGDLQGGAKYGRQALKLMENFPSPSSTTLAQAVFMVNCFVFPWTMPLSRLQKPLLLAYDTSLRLGDADHALWAIFFWMLFRLMRGCNLEELEADFLVYSTQMKDLGKVEHLVVTKNIQLSVLNLMGRNEESLGEPTSEVITMEDLDSGKVDLDLSHSIILTFFGDHLRHANLAIGKAKNIQTTLGTSPAIPYYTFLKAASCFAAASQSKNRRYAKMGEKLRSQIKKWRRNGNPNVIGYDCILDAESAVLNGKKDDAMRYYEAAILFASQDGGHIQDAAFACERYGEFHLNITGNQGEAANQIKQSISFWKLWGAIGKVKHLESKYIDLLPQAPREIVAEAPGLGD